MTKIKICGLMTLEDVSAVNEAKPDYAGFVFAGGRHHVSLNQAKQLIERLSPAIKTVGVFVDETVRTIAEIARCAPLDVIQLHGGEPAADGCELKYMTGCEIWKAIRVKDRRSVEEFCSYPADRFLLDTFSVHAAGGSGEPFDWRVLSAIATGDIILAGGVSCANAAEAIREFAPYMLDVSSGVETDGRKDPEKIKTIVSLVRRHSGNAAI